MKRRRKKNKAVKQKIIFFTGLVFVLLAILGTWVLRGEKPKDISGVHDEEFLPEVNVDVETLPEVNSNEEALPEVNNNEESLWKDPNVLYQTEEIDIYTIFPSSVINTDGKFEYVDNLASLEFKNISGKYWKKCDIHVELENGETYRFFAEDIPAGMEVMAFEVSNKTIQEEIEVEKFVYSIETDTSEVLMTEQLEVSVDGTVVTIKNVSKNDLSNLIVICHCMLDETSYGGSKYEYSLEKIAAGATSQIEAVDCYFGQAKVVRIILQ